MNKNYFLADKETFNYLYDNLLSAPTLKKLFVIKHNFKRKSLRIISYNGNEKCSDYFSDFDAKKNELFKVFLDNGWSVIESEDYYLYYSLKHIEDMFPNAAGNFTWSIRLKPLAPVNKKTNCHSFQFILRLSFLDEFEIYDIPVIDPHFKIWNDELTYITAAYHRLLKDLKKQFNCIEKQIERMSPEERLIFETEG